MFLLTPRKLLGQHFPRVGLLAPWWFGVILGWPFFQMTAFAQLKWAQPNQTFKPGILETNVVARFAFSNGGKYPIMISAADASCACTVLTFQKKSYLPGESGELVANFNLRDREGLEQKGIAVQTNDPKNPVAILQMTVDIPLAMEVTPPNVRWMIGGPKNEKTFKIKIAEGYPFESLKLLPTQGVEFTGTLVVIKEKSEYQLKIVPVDLSKIAAMGFQLLLNEGTPHARRKLVLAISQSAPVE